MAIIHRSFSVACFVATLTWGALASAGDVDTTPATLASALAAARPGDTIHLAPGHYSHFSVRGVNGTANAWISITGPAVEPPTAIIDADPVPCCNTVEIAQSSYVAIEHLLIDGRDVDGAFGINASGTGVHHIRVESNTLVRHAASQSNVGISIETPTWGWVIRRNKISGVGTGLYIGHSNGSNPFIGGLIEENLVENPIGYCMEIKFQRPRPVVAGMPTDPTTTIIRNNVFIKNDGPSPSGDRPNVLVGGFPDTGPGSQDRYEIYGNFFFHNPREALLQASGRVTIHDNVFVDAMRALTLQNHDLPLKQAFVYDNTIYAVGTGIRGGSAAAQGEAVVGNVIFADTPLSGVIAGNDHNLTDSVANASLYVKAPSKTLGAMDFYPLSNGQCTGELIDPTLFKADTDFDIDFNGTPRGDHRYRGAYAGSGQNPGWALAAGLKTLSLVDAGAAPKDAGTSDPDAGATTVTDAGGSMPPDAGAEGGRGHGGCHVGGSEEPGLFWLIVGFLSLGRRRAKP